MAQATRYTGKALNVLWIYSGGTVDLSADFRTLKVSAETDSAESAAGSQTHKSYIPTLIDSSAELEFLDITGSTGSTQWMSVAPQMAGTLIWSPQGTTSGKPKHTCTDAFVINREREIPYDDVVQVTVGWQFNVAQKDNESW